MDDRIQRIQEDVVQQIQDVENKYRVELEEVLGEKERVWQEILQFVREIYSVQMFEFIRKQEDVMQGISSEFESYYKE